MRSPEILFTHFFNYFFNFFFVVVAPTSPNLSHLKRHPQQVDNFEDGHDAVQMQLGEMAFGDPDELVEFVDLLGRTRTCRRAELPELMAADQRDRMQDQRDRDRRSDPRHRRTRSPSSSSDEGGSPRRDDSRYAAIPPLNAGVAYDYQYGH